MTVETPLLLGAARLTGWPRVRLYRGITLHGEGGWRATVARTTPHERGVLVRRLEPALLRATPDGLANLARWRAAGQPDPGPEALPKCYGDVEAVPIVVAMMQRLPASGRWLLLEDVSFDAVGFSSRAYLGPRPATALVCRVSPKATVETLLHEAAHRWHRSAHTVEAPLPDAVTYAAALIVAEGEGDAIWAAHLDDERLADAMAAAWLA